MKLNKIIGGKSPLLLDHESSDRIGSSGSRTASLKGIGSSSASLASLASASVGSERAREDDQDNDNDDDDDDDGDDQDEANGSGKAQENGGEYSNDKSDSSGAKKSGENRPQKLSERRALRDEFQKLKLELSRMTAEYQRQKALREADLENFQVSST